MVEIGDIFVNRYTGEEADLVYIDDFSCDFFSYYKLQLKRNRMVFTFTESQLKDYWEGLK